MNLTNDELGRQLAEQLMGGDMPVALDGDSRADSGNAEAADEQNPLETNFFRAINAFRAARSSGDAAEIAAAERRLQDVVRGELTGEACDS